MFSISPFLYHTIFIWVFSIPILFIFIKNVGISGNNYLLTPQSKIPMFLLVALLALFVGFRPVSGAAFNDMYGYNLAYQMFPVNTASVGISIHTEWLWDLIMYFCKKIGWPATNWFALISLGYFGLTFWACAKLLHENVTVAILFILSSFSFFAYGTNTIRNGLACSIILLAFAFWAEGKKQKIISIVLMFLAMGVHRSVIIPIIALLVSHFLIKKTSQTLVLWILCVLVSSLLGETFFSFFSAIGFDARFQKYMEKGSDAKMFSHTGFRWDFLLYSSIPVIVTYYAAKVRSIKDKTFIMLSNTYIIANSIWILCIRASYSDRFAYLSWFMYSLVLAYAFIRLHLFDNQDKVMSWALLFNAAFTVFMFNFYG